MFYKISNIYFKSDRVNVFVGVEITYYRLHFPFSDIKTSILKTLKTHKFYEMRYLKERKVNCSTAESIS